MIVRATDGEYIRATIAGDSAKVGPKFLRLDDLRPSCLGAEDTVDQEIKILAGPRARKPACPITSALIARRLFREL